MIAQKIHPEGPVFSRVVAGAWRWHNISVHELDRLINASIDVGVTTFDHADIYGDYGNEKIFGDALRRNPGLAANLQIVTKCGIKLLSAKKPEHRVKHYDTSKNHIIASVENSLQLLAVDKIDLLLLHRPDPLMNVAEVAEAFHQLKRQGKVMHFGVSNFTPAQFDLLQSALSFKLVTNQLELSLFYNDYFFNGTVDHLYQHSVSPMAWSPLGGGKPFDENHEVGKRVNALAPGLMEKYHCDLPQLLLSWLLHHPATIFPVVGTSKVSRLEEAVRSTEVKLDRQDWFEMLRWVRGADVP